MPANAIGEINPNLLAQCPPMPVPADADRLPVHVTAWGDAGPSVLFVHGGVQGGIGGGPANFKGQKPLATRGWRLKLIARPGFGESPSRGPDDMEADAILIADMLSEPTHLIGHSFGGAEVLLAAARRPEAVRSLILVEPALQPMLMTDPESAADPASKAAAEIILKYLLSGTSPADYAIGFVGSLGTSTDGGENAIVAGLKADRDYAARLGCSLLRARMETPAGMRAAADAVAQAGIPVLVISGGYSEGQEATGRAIARLTGGRHQVVAAPSHFLQEDSPEAFNNAVDAFIRGVEAKARA